MAERAAARKSFHKYPTPSNKTLYNKTSKKTKETLSEVEKSSWGHFLSSLGPQTPSSRVWKNFKCMKGRAPNSIIPFSNRKDESQDPKQSAEMLAQHYRKNFSNQTTPPNKQFSYVGIACRDITNQHYNRPLEYHEQGSEIEAPETKSSTGKDLIHNHFLTNLSRRTRSKLLQICNKIDVEGCIPSDWKIADIIQIQKPGKDPENPATYRLISLLSCVEKLMERM